MKNTTIVALIAGTLLSSCVSNKKFAAVSEREEICNTALAEVTADMKKCEDDKTILTERLKALQTSNDDLRNQIKNLNETTSSLLNNVGNLTTLSSEGAKNLERSLESIKEKDIQINYLRDAVTKRDSVTLALVTSIKGVLGNMQDEDIEVNVEKGVVYIAISDKLLFSSGSYRVNDGAKSVLGKVAKVVKNKPKIEFMVEGHTDSVPISKAGITDNWDLSVLRAASIVRTLQTDFGVEPNRMTAAGRSYYMPKASNDTPEGRSANRRTRIVILPKLDQFYSMVEDGMKEAVENDKMEQESSDGKE
ncbi:MAG TPA: OmpA family protein [Cryomorphaceae bacterium]|nr:OmpA family protein [Cryomorphaceae bacterium]